MPKIKNITVEGKTFKSKIEACKYYNINYSTVNSRLRRGWSIEEALNIKKHMYSYTNYCEEIELNGEKITVHEACKKYNIPSKNVYSRQLAGWSLEEIFGLKYRNNNAIMVKVKNKIFESIKKASDYYNVNYNTVIQRLHKGMDIEEAIFKPVVLTNNGGGKRKPITVEGKRYASIKEACDYYNLNYGTVKSRLLHNKSIEEAFELKKGNIKNDKK